MAQRRRRIEYEGKMWHADRYSRARPAGSARVTITAEGSPWGGKFRAFVWYGKYRTIDGGRMKLQSCGAGKNPRKAIAAAFRALAGNIGRRKGAFAAWR